MPTRRVAVCDFASRSFSQEHLCQTAWAHSHSYFEKRFRVCNGNGLDLLTEALGSCSHSSAGAASWPARLPALEACATASSRAQRAKAALFSRRTRRGSAAALPYDPRHLPAGVSAPARGARARYLQPSRPSACRCIRSVLVAAKDLNTAARTNVRSDRLQRTWHLRVRRMQHHRRVPVRPHPRVHPIEYG
jgi:hypothetical protein